MTRNTFTLGKLVVIGLALSIPFILYRSLTTRVESLRRDARVQAYFSDDRNRILQQVFERQLEAGLLKNHVIFERKLPDGPIVGLPPFPKDAMLQYCQLQEGNSDNGPSNYLTLLRQDDVFPSGLPKRFAGWLELTRQTPLLLPTADVDRFVEVAEQFWQGLLMNNQQMLFLIKEKLNPALVPLFEDHLLFLGGGKPPADGRVWLKFTEDEYMRMAALPSAQQLEIARDLQALSLDVALQPGSAWTALGDLQISLKTISKPLGQRIHRERLLHGGLMIILLLVCVLIFSILHKYQKVNRLQKQLLASTSHELRTPLAVIRQFSEMLMIRPQQFSDKVQTYHNHIYRECMKLQFLVENLLTAAKFENLDATPKPVALDLDDWLKEEVSALQQVVGDHRIQLQADPVAVVWDPGLISQVLTNLVDNAAKHARTDMEVVARQVGARIHLSVRDFGKDYDLERIRQIRAFQTQATTKTSLGLGLFLARKMVMAHGGDLDFEKAEPGLRVMLDLPRELKLG